MKININISCESRFLINRSLLAACVERLITQHKLGGMVHVEILIVGDRKMRMLNATYRKIDDTTDVLSFPLQDAESHVSFIEAPDQILRLGSVVISYPQAVKEAGDDGVLVDEKINQLIEHGLNHLLGIHHE